MVLASRGRVRRVVVSLARFTWLVFCAGDENIGRSSGARRRNLRAGTFFAGGLAHTAGVWACPSGCLPVRVGENACAVQGVVEPVGEQADLGHDRILRLQQRDETRVVPVVGMLEKQQPAQVEQPATQARGQGPGLAQAVPDCVDEPRAVPIGKQDRGMAERCVVLGQGTR